MNQASYKIYDSNLQKLITLDELVNSVEETDVLFFGEEHNDSLAHALQDSIYGLLLETYGTVALSMEMFETDCQLVLDEYLGGFITEAKMTKDARAWNNYEEAYRPMVERAKERDQVVIAANAPRRYVSIVSKKGLDQLASLPKESLAFLPPLPIYTNDEAYHQRFQQAMGGAEHAMDDKIFHAQCTWDASMAYSIYKHWKKNKKDKVFHLNGRFHTDHQQGTTTQLFRLSNKINAKNISCGPVDDFENPDWETYRVKGDFIIISPQK